MKSSMNMRCSVQFHMPLPIVIKPQRYALRRRQHSVHLTPPHALPLNELGVFRERYGGGKCGRMLFVLALRHLGTARTGAYFSVAPFAGAAIALVMLGETPDPVFWVAAGLMGTGIWLHLTETHAHAHTHVLRSHAHGHSHDAHHQHSHDFPWDGKEPHSHPHQHEPLTHSHPHFPRYSSPASALISYQWAIAVVGYGVGHGRRYGWTRYSRFFQKMH